MARDDDFWGAAPELRAVGHGVRGLWRHRRLVAAVVVLWAAVAAWSVDSRFRIPLAVVGLPVVWWMLTEPAQFAVFVGLRRAPAALPGGDLLRGTFTPGVREATNAAPPVEHLRAVKVGWTIGEDGKNLKPWTLRLWGTPILLGGTMGAGKSVLLWAIFHGAAEWIPDGTVEVWALDPKGGMELGFHPELFTEYWDPIEAGETEENYGKGAAELLEKACRRLRAQAAAAKGKTRAVEPSPESPLLVIVIDEIASFAYAVADTKVKGRIDRAIRYLCSQGRAVAVQVIGAVQDPRVETMGYRDLFPVRVGLRMTHSGQPDVFFGQGAREAGAYCDLIPEEEPGVAYVKEPGTRAYRKVKALAMSDADVETLVRDYAPRRAS